MCSSAHFSVLRERRADTRPILAAYACCPHLENNFFWRSLEDRKSTRLNSSHRCISYAVFCLKKKNVEASPAEATRAPLPRATETALLVEDEAAVHDLTEDTRRQTGYTSMRARPAGAALVLGH